MAENHESTPETLSDIPKKEGLTPIDMPTVEHEARGPNKPGHEDCRRMSELKPALRTSSLRQTNLLSRKKVSFSEDIRVIAVKSYKSFNRPEFMSDQKKCCGNRCVIF
jgi:hypothetical protein